MASTLFVPGLARSSVSASGQHAGATGPARAGDEETVVEVDVEDQLRRATWIQRTLERKLLTPSEELSTAHADFLDKGGKGEPRGIARVLKNRSEIDGLLHPLPIKENGAYYSFISRENSYDSAPQICFSEGEFSTSGDQCLLPLGSLDLASLSTDAGPPPPGLSAEMQIAWAKFWEERPFDGNESSKDSTSPIAPFVRHRLEAEAGDVFVLRSSGSTINHLVAFQVVQVDRLGCTILWRQLREWPTGKRYVPKDKEPSDTPEAPERMAAELDALSVDQLLDRLRDMRERLATAFFFVSEEEREEYAKMSQAGPDQFGRQGYTRIYRRFKLTPLSQLHGSGAYIRFRNEDHSYTGWSDLGLNRFGNLTSGGWILDLGELEPRDLREALAGRSPLPAGEQNDAWSFVRRTNGETKDRRRCLEPEDERREKALRIESGALPIEWHTYLLRSAPYDVDPPGHDTTVLFTVLTLDSYGATLAWRVL